MNLMFITLAEPAAAAGGGMSSILMIVAIFAIFYFFMIRPQTKRQKEVAKFQNQLEKGTKVVTQGGVFGIVKEVKENVARIEIAKNVEIEVLKSMLNAAEAPEAKK